MSTQMTIELSAEKPRKHEFYRATLDLPATELQIEDALSRARFQNESSQKFIDIEEAVMFDPSHLSVTADDIHALNYLAKRLDSLSEEDEIKFEALYYARTTGGRANSCRFGHQYDVWIGYDTFGGQCRYGLRAGQIRR